LFSLDKELGVGPRKSQSEIVGFTTKVTRISSVWTFGLDDGWTRTVAAHVLSVVRLGLRVCRPGSIGHSAVPCARCQEPIRWTRTVFVVEPATLAALAAGAFALYKLASRSKTVTTATNKGPTPLAYPAPKLAFGVPFAVGNQTPAWPIPTTKNPEKFSVSYIDEKGEVHGNYSRRFGAVRKEAGPDRHHVGVDLYGNPGDPLVAMEDGTVVAFYPTFNLGTGVLYLATDSGITLVYGEIDPHSWEKYGIVKGMRVQRGQKLAQVGCMKGTFANCESHMLHLESYQGVVEKNEPWYDGNAPAPNIRNPTLYLLRAKQAAQAIG